MKCAVSYWSYSVACQVEINFRVFLSEDESIISQACSVKCWNVFQVIILSCFSRVMLFTTKTKNFSSLITFGYCVSVVYGASFIWHASQLSKVPLKFWKVGKSKHQASGNNGHHFHWSSINRFVVSSVAFTCSNFVARIIWSVIVLRRSMFHE